MKQSQEFRRLALPCVEGDLDRLLALLAREPGPTPTTVLLPTRLAPAARAAGLHFEPHDGRSRIEGHYDECWLFRDTAGLRSGRVARAALAAGIRRFRIVGPEADGETPASRAQVWRAIAHAVLFRGVPAAIADGLARLDVAACQGLVRVAPRRLGATVAPRRVDLLIPTLGLGGAQRQLLSLVHGLVKQGYRCRVWVFDDRDGFFSPHVAATGAPVATVWHGAGVWGGPARLAWEASGRRALTPVAAALWCALRRDPPAVLHAFMDTASAAAALAGRQAGVPVVIAGLRSLHPRSRRIPASSPVRRSYDLVTPDLVDAVVANSHAGLASLRERQPEFPAAQLRVVHNGVDTDGFRESASAADGPGTGPLPPLVVWVGRPAVVKRPELAVQAAALVLRGGTEMRLQLVGPGPLNGRLAAIAAELGLGDRLRCLPPMDDIGALLAAARVVLLTSDEEGLPNVLLEAHAMGKPVVATRVGGVAEVVEEGVTGFLVPPGDGAALADRLTTLLRDADLAAKMGRAGRERVLRLFPMTAMVSQTLQVYDELAAARADGSPVTLAERRAPQAT